MGAADSVKSLGSSLGDSFAQVMGVVEKAQLKVVSSISGGDQEMVDIGSEKDGDITIQKAVTIEKAASSLPETPAIKIPETQAGFLNRMISLAKTKNVESTQTFYVQFNPKELVLSAHGGGMYQKTDFGGNTTDNQGSSKGDKGGVELSGSEVRIEMTVPLIFDQVNNTDAFMFDKFLLSPSNLIKEGAQVYAKLKQDKNYSVQPVVEALIGAVRDVNFRKMEFSWNKIHYIGVVNNMSANYTMFSVSGQPVRAVVNLSMVLTDPAIGNYGYGLWADSFKKAFGSENGLGSLTNTTQKFGNLINL